MDDNNDGGVRGESTGEVQKYEGEREMSDRRIEEMQTAFLEQHRDADELVYGVVSGVCLAAVYYSPKEKAVERPLRTFFKAVVDAETISEERKQE